jgi:hypothetical protein
MAEEVYAHTARSAATDGFTASAELTAEHELKQAAVRVTARAAAREAAALPGEAIPGVGEVVMAGVGVLTVLDIGYEIYKFATR